VSGLEVTQAEEIEGLLLTPGELDRIVYVVRELPKRLRGLGEQAFESGYLAAIRATDPRAGAKFFGDAVASITADVLYRATRGLTIDERENPFAGGGVR
jgi:hypothetical protein